MATTEQGAIQGAVPQKRALATGVPGPKSKALAARRSASVAPGVSSSAPVYVERGEGAILVDVDGNCFIDMGSGIAVNTVGHSVPQVVDAIREQAGRFTHTCFMVGPYEGYVAVCEELNALTPGDHSKTSVLFNSGAEAVENLVKVARRATGRSAVVVFDHAYHGRTNLTMALTAKNLPYKDGFGPFAPEVYRVPMSYPFRDPPAMTGEEAALRATDLIEKQVGSRNVACVLVEPVQGEGGFVVPAPGFLRALAGWCADHDVLFAADEVQSGFCRTGKWFACEHEGVVPDLVATAKGIAAGMPLSAVTGKADLMAEVHPGGLGGTYSGNPVACAAALATIGFMRDRDLASAAARIGDKMSASLGRLKDRHGAVGDVRGLGAMQAMEFVLPGTTEPDPAAAGAVVAACLSSGVLALTCGTWSNVVRLLPPLTIGDDLLQDALDVIGEAVGASVG